MPLLKNLALFAALCLLPALSSAAAPLPKLHKGVNFAAWLANAPRQPLYLRDFIQVKTAGFDHLRLPFNPEEFGFNFDDPNSTGKINLAPLDKAVALGEGQGLKIILDMHPRSDFMKRLENDPKAQKQFIDLWVMLARHYQSHDPNLLLFELLNEPQYYHAEDRYHAFTETLIQAIRRVDPNRAIVLSPSHGASLDELLNFQIFPEARLIYDFHFYEPYMVTHQGIHMGFEGKMLRYFKNVPYPAAKVNHPASYYAPNAPDPDQASAELKEYADGGWDAAHLRARIDLAKEWGEKNHVPLICGEFGALKLHIDPASRYQWIEDVRKAFEADGIGWEIWDYSDLFGITAMIGATNTDPVDGSSRFIDPENGTRRLEPAAIEALGLKYP